MNLFLMEESYWNPPHSLSFLLIPEMSHFAKDPWSFLIDPERISDFPVHSRAAYPGLPRHRRLFWITDWRARLISSLSCIPPAQKKQQLKSNGMRRKGWKCAMQGLRMTQFGSVNGDVWVQFRQSASRERYTHYNGVHPDCSFEGGGKL